MISQIDKETKIFGSFSENPGNNGCIFFNDAFKRYQINAIYKSFYSDDISETIQAVKHLRFSGFALSAPHKIKIIRYLNEVDNVASEIGSVNTVVNKEGNLIGYNTDYIGVRKFLESLPILDNLNVIGNGGFSRAIQYALKKMNINFKIYQRNDLDKIDKTSNEIFINATPIEINSNKNKLIDLRPQTKDGKLVAKFQAIEQFKIYTGIDYES